MSVYPASLNRHAWLALVLVAAGCVPPGTLKTPHPSPAASIRVAASAIPSPEPAVDVPASTTPTSTHFGQVLGLDGKPAAGVPIKAYLITENGAGIITNNGGNVIANNGGSIIGDNGGSLIANNSAGRHLLDTGLSAVSDAEGFFPALVDPQGRPLNLEAVQQADVKAISFGIKPGASGVVLQLARTGSISGKVTAKGVTDFFGVDVFVPGTSYVAKADHDGSYIISNVPVGSFTIGTAKTGLGRAEVTGVKVASDKTTEAPPLELVATPPVIASVTPTDAPAGATITVKGEHFGTGEGATFTVSINGSQAVAPKRVDEQTLTFTVPDAATSGDLLVSVAGLQSNAWPIKVFDQLYTAPALQTMFVGDSQPLVAQGHEKDDQFHATRAVTWTATGAVAIEDGKLVAKTAGTGTLTGQLDKLTLNLPVTVSPVGTPLVVTIAGVQRRGSEDFKIVDGATGLAHFGRPGGIVMDGAGNYYIADVYYQLIRKVSADGLVSTLAGTVSKQGFADGEGAAARFYAPADMVMGKDGALIVADASNNRLRRVTTAGVVTTLAGDGTIGNTDGPTASARFDRPNRLTQDGANNLYVMDGQGKRIRKLTPDGQVSTVFDAAGSGITEMSSIASDATGTLFAYDNKTKQVWRISAGAATALPGTFKQVIGLAVGPDGSPYAMDIIQWYDIGGATTRLVKIAADGKQTVVLTSHNGTGAYADGPLTTAGFSAQYGLRFLPDGSMLAFDGDDDGWIPRRFFNLPLR